jgi:transposase
MHYVAIKTVEQQDIQAVHRVRSELMSHRNAKANQIRGLVAEYGLVAPQQLGPLRAAIPCWLEDAQNGLTDRFRALLHGLWEDLTSLDQRIKVLDTEVAAIAATHPDAKRLQQLRGVGPLVATALVAKFGDASHFKQGRQAAASVGLTPRHHGTGGKNRIFGITKHGDPYLRSILIHGARAVVSQAKQRDDRLSRWATELAQRSHMNVAAVALANKTVRMAWAMLRNGTDYDPELAVAQV